MQVPAPFDYARASSVDEAIALLERLGPEARLVAGGHSLLPMMKLRLATPEHLIDINPLESELNYIREEGGLVRIGALTRHRDVLASEVLARHYPIVREAEELIADPPVRNRGTVGGALCQADPSEDLSAVFAALGAVTVIRGSGGERVVTMEDFHEGPYETAVGDAEMLVEVRVPIREHGGSAYEKVKRRTGDWATAASGVALWLDGANVGAAGIALSAVNPTGIRSTRAEQALIGRPPSEEAFAEAAALAAEDCNPATDQRGPADYKRHLAQELTHRALRRAAERALAS
ncbi:MAG: xanthine dehydrogenase family protein subunit M [Solirubrobacterales bacterium]|nr:xanthine dehydrogenase family protein subunit M [Solirubrobacterales bacterium]